jgi:hypothetical protein
MSDQRRARARNERHSANPAQEITEADDTGDKSECRVLLSRMGRLEFFCFCFARANCTCAQAKYSPNRQRKHAVRSKPAKTILNSACDAIKHDAT